MSLLARCWLAAHAFCFVTFDSLQRYVSYAPAEADCTELRQYLEGIEGWDEDALPQSLESWRAEYQRLKAVAEGQGRSLRGLLSITWAEFEEYLGISETERKMMYRLANTPVPTQEALLATDLPQRHQIATTSRGNG